MNETHPAFTHSSSGVSESDLVVQSPGGETYVSPELLQQLRRARAAAIEAARRDRAPVAE